MALSSYVVDGLGKGKLARDNESAERHIPFTRFLDRGILATKDGDLAIVFELEGIPHALADSVSLGTARNALARVARSVGDGYNLIYTHTLRMRRDTGNLLDPIESDGFDGAVDERYRAQLAENTLYELRHFITLVRRPIAGSTGMLQSALESLKGVLVARSYRQQDEQGVFLENRKRAMQALESAATVMLSDLSRFGIRRLGDTREDKRTTLTYLSMLASGIWQDQPLVSDFLSHALGTGRITFGGEMFRITGPSPKGNRVGAMLAIQAYDENSFSGMFDELLSERIEFILTQSFLTLDRLVSRDEAANQAKRMADSGDDAESSRIALREAVDGIAKGDMVLGQHHLSIAVFTDTEAELVEAVARINTSLGASGLKMRREDVGLEAAFWAQLPGNVAYQTRAKHRMISNENFADFCAFHTHPQGERHRLTWGAPVTVFPTFSATAHYFSFHAAGSNANGNTLIFGPPGSGKTAIAGFLLAQTRRMPRPPRIIYFDKDRGAESMVRALGGDYIDLGPESGSGFNPFSQINDEVGAEWLSGFIERLAVVDLSPEQIRRIYEAAMRNAESDDPSLKTFGNFLSLLHSVDDGGGQSLTDHLTDWMGQGARAWLFDNQRDTFTISDRALGVDMTSLLKNPRTRSAALDYLFYRIERVLEDGYPTIIFLDEGWKLLADERFADRIRDWMKTIRKLNGILCFATQEPADAAKSPISETLIQSAETMLFFANGRADIESYVERFQLSDIEFETVRGLSPERRAILVKQSAGSVLIDAQIDDPDTLKVFSGTAESVKHMDAMRAEYGNDWLEPYIKREIGR